MYFCCPLFLLVLLCCPWMSFFVILLSLSIARLFTTTTTKTTTTTRLVRLGHERKEMISPTNAILTGLAVADMLVMADYVPYTIHNYIHSGQKMEEMYSYEWTVYALFHAHFSVVCHAISIWLTLLLAIWRYIAVRLVSIKKSMKEIKRIRKKIDEKTLFSLELWNTRGQEIKLYSKLNWIFLLNWKTHLSSLFLLPYLFFLSLQVSNWVQNLVFNEENCYIHCSNTLGCHC